MTLSCLLVDDSPHFLAAARELLEREGVVVAGVASDIAGALGQAARLGPDVALVDVNLGPESGFELAERLPPGIRVIMISTHDPDDYADLVAAGPAVGFLAKTALSAAAVRELIG